ncbi:hypothetical protein H4R21_000419 [Coemansia helicoidea]|uniref:Uncharacterized protein n=1 Tax=Coemansia helicoidea TaxID=1286919 RepID=A0ACC1LH83_9FUNG|nr:hypothetical protein H4R21_000419 [Coemansia helicoidea]
MKLRSRGQPAVVRPGAGSRWLEQLPDVLLGLVLRCASGTARVDAYANGVTRADYRFELELMSEMISERTFDMAHVCRRWRQILAPAFYHYAVYDGREGRLLVPDGCEQHIRWLLVQIPKDFGSYRSVVRALYWLPQEVRSRVLWLGLCMGARTAMSVSEYGPLAAAFPDLRQIWLDLGRLATNLRDVCPAITGSEVLAPITALMLREDKLENREVAASLVRAAAATLTRLDIWSADISAVCEVLWSPDGRSAGREPLFPQLVRLSMKIFNAHSGQVVVSPKATPFPKLEVLVCHESTWLRAGSRPEDLHDQLQRFVAMLLEHIPARLRRLSIDSPDGDIPEVLGGGMQQLEVLQLVYNRDYYNRKISLQRVLEMAMAIPKLRALEAESATHIRNQPLALSCPCHMQLCVLDISSWFLTLCDLQLLLSKLPRLEEARVTLTRPQIHPAREEISYHMAMRRLWVDSVSRSGVGWGPDSLEPLTTMLARMPRLSEALLFYQAVRWITKTTARRSRNREGLLHLALHVNIGRCNIDEMVVQRATSLFL